VSSAVAVAVAVAVAGGPVAVAVAGGPVAVAVAGRAGARAGSAAGWWWARRGRGRCCRAAGSSSSALGRPCSGGWLGACRILRGPAWCWAQVTGRCRRAVPDECVIHQAAGG
jgi:antitoxin (DNA-binding transcriptional repressor) of toxin-antitoxin stability system